MTGTSRNLDSCHRAEALSDGVFAITLTLLVLEIHRPSPAPGQLASDLLKAWPAYLAYVMAFCYAGIIWLNHHAIFRCLAKVDLKLNFLNLLGLGATVLIPFPAVVMADAFRAGDMVNEKTAVVLYAVVCGLMSAAWIPIFPYLAKHPELVKPEVPEGLFEAQVSRPFVGVGAYSLAALLGGFVSPYIAIVLFVFMIVYHAVTSQGLPVRQPKAESGNAPTL